jgi:hypothetical protein
MCYLQMLVVQISLQSHGRFLYNLIAGLMTEQHWSNYFVELLRILKSTCLGYYHMENLKETLKAHTSFII